MAFSGSGGQPFSNDQFDIFEWHPFFQSCVVYFLDHAQYNGPVQALAAHVNIQLPFQRALRPVLSSRSATSPSPAGSAIFPPNLSNPSNKPHTSQSLSPTYGYYPNATLLPYIRRLVATGYDHPSVLHSFFGDDWEKGVGPLHETERRNYLFAAKSDTWLTVKQAYDMGDDQMVPFLKPLQQVSEKEICAAEGCWSEWLAMQDWMLGPRAPGGGRNGNGNGGYAGKGRRVKKEED
ncbi:hypothetical protein B0T14DRAFT_279370 [Immersiella caudata]|uniref:Ilp is an apoptosis inhibitor n=1 Tax=Immersiella caudata TaxID=314043 RepID=A0AA40BTV1_9PEZI|nr:hypothetical protein B0T14DRAFT_279370 [Immersiella caudata]